MICPGVGLGSMSWSRDKLRGLMGRGGGVALRVDFLNRPIIRDMDDFREREGCFVEVDLEGLRLGNDGFLVNR